MGKKSGKDGKKKKKGGDVLEYKVPDAHCLYTVHLLLLPRN
jgi:hypothetical protein